MGWGNTLQSIASAILGGSSQAEQRYRDNPYSEENGGPGNSFVPWRGEEDDDPATEIPQGRRSVSWDQTDEGFKPRPAATPDDGFLPRYRTPIEQPSRIPAWLSDPSASVIPRGTTPSAPGPAQQDSTTKQDDADVIRIKDHLAKSMENLRRLEAIDPNDKETMATYGHTKTYKPGTMKKRDGKMVDVGGQTKKDSVLMNIGKGLLASMKNIAPIMLDKNVDNRTALGYALGAGAGGGIRYGMDGTIDEQEKLARDKERAQQQVTGAQGAYDANAKNRQTEANIDWTNARPDLERDKIKQKYEEEKGKNFGRATSRMKALMDAMTKGPLSIHQNGQFLDTLADLAGVQSVKIADFDPRTDTIIRAETIHDNTSGETTTVTYNKGGKVVTAKVIDEATGKPLVTKSDRAYVADKAAATQITTTKMRTESAEKIAQWDGQVRITLKNLGIAADKEAMVYDEYVRLKSDPTTIERIEAQFPDDDVAQYNAIVQLALKAAAAGKVAPQP